MWLSWGNVKCGEYIGKEEAGKSEKREVYVGLQRPWAYHARKLHLGTNWSSTIWHSTKSFSAGRAKQFWAENFSTYHRSRAVRGAKLTLADPRRGVFHRAKTFISIYIIFMRTIVRWLNQICERQPLIKLDRSNFECKKLEEMTKMIAATQRRSRLRRSLCCSVSEDLVSWFLTAEKYRRDER